MYSVSYYVGCTLVSWVGSVHAQRGLQCLVCLSVCVDAYSGTTGYEAAYERYQWLQNYAKLKQNNFPETTVFGDMV